MKIIKPLDLSLLYKVYETQRNFKLVATIISFFSFSKDNKLKSEIDLWKFVPEELGKDAALDLAMPKPQGEILLSAKFFSSNGEPVPAGKVSFSLGERQKSLHVFGDRYWKRQIGNHWILTEPRPLNSLDINYENSFGGEGFTRNPIGKGYIPTLAEAKEDFYPVPNIIDPRYPIRTPEDSVSNPAGFGPYDLNWPQRFSKVGTYDEKWLKELFPGYARDFDPSFFNAAPQDQQISGFFVGEEKFSCENMHPERPIQSSQLPGIQPRCFIHQMISGEKRFLEISLNLDTVWLFPHAERGVMIHRGQAQVADDMASDVSEILLAYERLLDESRAVEHYVMALEKRLDEEEGYLHDMEDKELIPDGASSTLSELLAREPAREGEGYFSQNMQASLDLEMEKTREKIREQGLNPDDYLDPAAIQKPEITIDNLRDLDVIVGKLLKDAEEQQEKVKQTFREMSEEAGRDFDAAFREAESKPLEKVRFSARETIRQIEEHSEIDEETREKLIGLEKQQDEAYRRHGHFFPPAALPMVEKSEQLRSFVLSAYEKGESLEGADLTGVDLRGQNLQGINLHNALMEGANLCEADLGGSNLCGCLLARADCRSTKFDDSKMVEVNLGLADLTDASFENCNMEEAEFYQATLKRARFRGANVRESDFMECRGEQAEFDGADLSSAQFLESRLDGCRMRGSILYDAFFLKSQVNRVDFSEADLTSALFVESKGDGANFTRAKLNKLCATMEVSFCEAEFIESKLNEANLRGVDLEGANFTCAEFSRADLSEANLRGCNFYRAVAKQAMLMKVDLEGANMVGMNLFEGCLQGARLYKTDLRGSNLFAVDFLRTNCQHVLLEKAVISRTLLET